MNNDEIIEKELEAVVKFIKSDQSSLFLFCNNVKGRGCTNCKYQFICTGELSSEEVIEKFPEHFL